MECGGELTTGTEYAVEVAGIMGWQYLAKVRTLSLASDIYMFTKIYVCIDVYLCVYIYIYTHTYMNICDYI